MIRANRLQKTSNWLDKFVFFYVFDNFSPFVCPRANSSLRSSLICSFFKEQLERLAHVALYKRATMSDSLRLLMTKERPKRFALFHKQIPLSLICSQKPSRSIKKPMSKFPTQKKWPIWLQKSLNAREWLAGI